MTTTAPPRGVTLLELDSAERDELSRLHPELRDAATVLVLAVDAVMSDGIRRELARSVADANEAAPVRLEWLVDGLLSAIDATPAGSDEEARRTALRRARLLQDYGAYTATELFERSGWKARNHSQLAYRLRRSGRIFGVPYRGAILYPTFQFGADARPLPVVAEVLVALADWDGWAVAEWFVRRSPFLGYRRPVEVLTSAPGELARAATDAAQRTRQR